MVATINTSPDTGIVPESGEAQIQELERMLQCGVPTLVGVDGARLEMPDTVFQILKSVVKNIGKGRRVKLAVEDSLVTTQQAADALGVSRPHLIKMLQAGEMPYHKTGSHRRIKRSDLDSYLDRRNAERKVILDLLAKDALEMGLYDETGIPEGGED